MWCGILNFALRVLAFGVTFPVKEVVITVFCGLCKWFWELFVTCAKLEGVGVGLVQMQHAVTMGSGFSQFLISLSCAHVSLHNPPPPTPPPFSESLGDEGEGVSVT